MELSKAIIGMLKENTGRSLGDSGDHYGRNYERNATANFKKQAPVVARFGKGGIDVSRNVYHFLMDTLQEHSPEMQKRFNAYCKRHSDEYPMTNMEGFAKDMNGGSDGVYIVNTYNGECNVSQTLQYVTFNHYGDAYILLQIHGGCDVRGGYTKPKVFRLEDDYLRNVAEAYVSCSSCDATWSTDDNYHYYADGACGLGAGTQLEKYDVVEVEDASEAVNHDGKLVVDSDGNGYCPHCHSKLIVS